MKLSSQVFSNINHFLKPNQLKFHFEGLNHIQRSINNTFICCTWDQPQYLSIVHLNQNAQILNRLNLETNFIPQFRMLDEQKVIILSKEKKANFIILWDIQLRQSTKLKIQGSLGSNCEINIFLNTSQVCIVDKNRFKKEFIITYFDLDNKKLKPAFSCTHKFSEQSLCKKINEQSGLVVYSKKKKNLTKQFSQSIQLSKIDYQGNITKIKIDCNKILGQQINKYLQFSINDIWQVKQDLIYFQIILRNSDKSAIFKDFYWNIRYQTCIFSSVIDFTTPHLFSFTNSYRQLSKQKIMSFIKISDITIIFISFDNQEKLAGIFNIPIVAQTSSNIYWPQFGLNSLMTYEIDLNHREIAIMEWICPFSWRLNPNIICIFFLEGFGQKWDQSLMESIMNMLQNTQYAVKLLL